MPPGSRATYCGAGCRSAAYRRRRATLDVANCHNDDCRASGTVALGPHALTGGVEVCSNDTAAISGRTKPKALWAVRAADAESRVSELAIPLRRAEEHTVAEAPSAVSGVAVVSVDVDALYRALLDELGLLAQRGGSAVGAAAVVKRVALAHGVAVAAVLPLPRLTRAELTAFARVGVSRERARQAVPRGR